MKKMCLAAAIVATACASAPTLAQTTDIANAPMAQAVSDNVKPNLMFVLDDSGSMAWRFMPDYVNDDRIDRQYCSNDNCSNTSRVGREGNPPWYAYQFNTLYYNPQITYSPAVNADGTSRTSYGSPWTNVPVDALTGNGGNINLVNGYPEIVYCRSANDNPNNASDASKCRRNGIDTTNPFQYDTSVANTNNGFPNGLNNNDFRFPRTRTGNPFYYEILPREYCSDDQLVNCTLSTTPTGTFIYPAYVRFCSSEANANSTSAVSGNSGNNPRCQAKYAPDIDGNGGRPAYQWPRYGRFQRVDIVPGTTTYGNRPNRADCAARPSCTYAEEMTNFANWYAYYSTRLQLMKTGAGQAFRRVDNRYRVGLVTINPTESGSQVSSNRYVRINTFEGSHRSDWYQKFYAITTNGSTPLREALSRVGRHFAGITTGINNGMSDDPIQYSCQRNVALLTTDGYWNGNGGQDLSGNAIGNQDNADSGFSKRLDGAFDGGTATNASDTLADVAMYYFKTDLRTSTRGRVGALGTDVFEDNVPTSSDYPNPQQHMVTFTLGLGVDGLMRYRPDYDLVSAGDFYSIRQGLNTCSSFSPTNTCNWPVPNAGTEGDPRKLDDLWHAAVNGRGRYISARDSVSLVGGLEGALTELSIKQGAAAASATSSPNVTESDNAIFSSTYRTVRWDGDLVKQLINVTTGRVEPAVLWSAASLLNTRAAANNRSIFTNVSGSLVSFTYSTLDATARTYFDNKCSLLAQCPSLDAPTVAIANNGTQLVNYLRGDRTNEGSTGAFRTREFVLADMAGSRPAFVREPRRAYADAVTPSYFDFKSANASRQQMLYIGSNGGMLHAFDAGSGEELWAFVPRAMYPNMFRLADTGYATAHRYYVDGSPTVGDAFNGTAWRTVLIGGYNAGGRGYYALDVTNPTSPTLMWEICADATLCSRTEANMGLSYANPVITKRASDGKWVALLTSGYNNVSPGDGRGYLYVVDLFTGNVLERVSTGVGSTTAPSGFAKINAWLVNPNSDNTTRYVYGGDLQGNLWRFDLTTSPTTVTAFATLRDSAGKAQPITTVPELGLIDSNRVVFVATGRLLGVSDLQDPSTLSPAGDWSYVGSIYGLKDTGGTLGNPRSNSLLVRQTISTLSPTQRSATRNPVNWATNIGWVVDLPTTGERVNIDPQLALGTLLVASNIPTTNACTAGGSSWIYQFDFRTGGAVNTAVDGTVGSYRAGTQTVGNVIVQLPNQSLKAISTGADGTKDTVGLTVGGGAVTPRRIGWREVPR